MGDPRYLDGRQPTHLARRSGTQTAQTTNRSICLSYRLVALGQALRASTSMTGTKDDKTVKGNPLVAPGLLNTAAFWINVHKALIPFVGLAFMHHFEAYTAAAWVLLALHSTYGYLWLAKDYMYPDKNFHAALLPNPTQGAIWGFVIFVLVLGPYYLPLFLVTKYHYEATLPGHWGSLAVVGAQTIVLWRGNMASKDASLARYPEFASWKARTWQFIPLLW